MTTPLLGDPASMSALGASLRRTAGHLAADGEALAGAVTGATPGWPGPRSVRLRRRTSTTAEQTTAVASALDEVGRSLQTAATDLAAAIARLRELEDAAATMGLEVREGAVTRGWGITGVADAAAAREEDGRRHRLQEQVHQTITALGRHRARLAKDLARGQGLLARAADELRR
ncbi:hypothetical protein [Janibacter alittae]|uniref:Uncharacterized protein n=1 Tax=Janibacter alittae TaxID=3115209 RepID=A0ABZ2MEN3_9MICO